MSPNCGNVKSAQRTDAASRLSRCPEHVAHSSSVVGTSNFRRRSVFVESRPVPLQSGHAPSGELKLSSSGVSSGRTRRHEVHVRKLENVSCCQATPSTSTDSVFPFAFSARTNARPFARRIAVVIASAMRGSVAGFAFRRSTTIRRVEGTLMLSSSSRTVFRSTIARVNP